MELMDEREERIVQRTSSKEKRIVTDIGSRDVEKGSNSNLHDELYFDQIEEFIPEGGEKFQSWKGQRRGSGHRYRSRWPSGRRMGHSFRRSRSAGRGSHRIDDLDEGEIFEIDADNLDENDDVLDEWGIERTEFANDGSLIVEEYVLDDESLQAGLQRYNSKYQRGRGGFRRPSSSRGRKTYERQRQYEKYEIIDEKTFGNYASHSRMRSPHYHESESYHESFDSDLNPHNSREWSKINWNRDDNPTYRKKSHSPDDCRSTEDKRYCSAEREESGKQFYENRYHLSSHAMENDESPTIRRKGERTLGPMIREEGSPVERSRRRSPMMDKRDYSPVSPQDQGRNWRREQPSSRSPAPGRERSWSRNRREVSPPAAYKRTSISPLDKRRAYSPSPSDKRDNTPIHMRGKDVASPKKRERSISPRSRGRRDSSLSSGKREHSLSPIARKQGKSSLRKRERSPSPVPRKRGRSSSSSSSQGDQSRSRSGSSQRELSDREDSAAYSSRAGGRSRDPRRSSAASGGHASQHSQDASWKQPSEATQEYSAIQPQHPQFGLESGGMAASSASTVYPGTYSTYGAQPDMSASAYHQAGHAGYEMYNYQSYYQQGAMQSAYGGEFSSHQMQPDWRGAEIILPDMTQPPPLQMQMTGSHDTDPEAKADLKKSEEARKEAIKKEQKEQKLTLIKQREEYYNKSSVLCQELELLREQKQELMEEKSCDNDRILKENGKLQLEIQNKLKAINNVIDMLTGIIGDKKERKEDKRKSSKEDGKTEKVQRRSPDSMKTKEVDDEDDDESDSPVYNYVYYDPEVHWCRVCDVFPRTAKEYLHHLHSTEHKELTAKKKLVDMPWHKTKTEQDVPVHKGAPSKRTAIKGLQFFISVSSWYCKLCDSWIGDLHCVSLHLKSKLHLENYKEFIEANPKWELEWLTEREKAFQRKNEEKLLSRGVARKDNSPMDFEPKMKDDADSDDGRETKVTSKCVAKEKTKALTGTWAEVVAAPPRTTRVPVTTALGGVAHRTKPRTVLGGDDSSESEEGEMKMGRSIRVSMRNKPKMTALNEPNRGSWNVAEREVKGAMKLKGEVGESEEEGEVQKSSSSRREEKSFQEWMPKAPAAISDNDRQLLSNIKDRLKQKQEAEKERDQEREKGEEKERKSDRDKYEAKEKSKGDHERYDRGRSWDRDRSSEKEWYRERDRRDRSRERKRGRSKRYGSISPRRRSSERRSRYEKKYEPYKERKRDRGEYRSDVRGDREEKVFSGKNIEELEKKFDPFSKKEKKVEPKPARVPKKLPDPTCPKTKLPFIGRMPLLKHIAKKKVPGSGMKSDCDGKGMEMDPDGEGIVSASSPSHETGKESSMDEMGKMEGVQDMDIDDDNSDSELADSREKDSTYNEQEEADMSKESEKQESMPVTSFSETNPQVLTNKVSPANSTTTSVVTKVSRFGPLMEMSSGPKLLTSFDHPTGVQVQLCAPARLAAAPPNLLVPPGTISENLPLADGGEAKPKTKVVDEIPLPKDFQDALNILFPEKSAMGGDQSGPLAPPGVSLTPPGMSESMQDMSSSPSGMVHHVGMQMPHGMPHPMHPMDPSSHHVYPAPPPMHMPPPMHHQMAMAGPPGGVLMASQMMGQPIDQQMQPMMQEGNESMIMPEEEPIPEAPEEIPPPEKVVRRKYVEMGEDELAMLGIDPEDMAAQTFAPKRPYP